MMRFDAWPDLRDRSRRPSSHPWIMALLITLIVSAIVIISCLFVFISISGATTWDDGWEPDANVTLRIVEKNGFLIFTPFLVGEYYTWEYTGPEQIPKMIAEEKLIHYIQGSQSPRSPPAPEPMSMLLMGSGLIGLWILGRRKR